MLAIRVRNASLKYDFARTGTTSTLWLDGALVHRLSISDGMQVKAKVRVTIDTAPRQKPHDIGSLLYTPPTHDTGASIDVWLHASPEDVEALYAKAQSAPFAYLLVQSPQVTGDTWRMGTDNSAEVDAFSFRASSVPCFDDAADATT